MSFEELAYSNMLTLNALVEPLDEQGILAKQDVLGRVKKLQAEMAAKRSTQWKWASELMAQPGIAVSWQGRRLFPGAVLHQAPPQGLAPSQQAVVRVRERKQRQEGEGLAATGAATAPDPNPVVMLIVRLLAAASMADDRIAFTHGTSPQDNLVRLSGPIGFELVRRAGKWDKKNRRSWGLYPGVDPPRSEPEAEPLLLKRKIQLEKNNASQLRL